MIIKRELKNHLWEFDEETKELTIMEYDGEAVVLDKVRWFSLFRFMIRAAYGLGIKRRKK